MIQLYEAETGQLIGSIDPSQLAMLQDQLDETPSGELDRYVDDSTIDFLKSAGADRRLVGLLEEAIALRHGFEIGWSML